MRFDLKELKEGFCQRGRGRSFHVDGLKTEKALKEGFCQRGRGRSFHVDGLKTEKALKEGFCQRGRGRSFHELSSLLRTIQFNPIQKTFNYPTMGNFGLNML